MSVCSAPGCNKPRDGQREWCRNHHYRWRRHGDPLGGRTPKGEPIRYLNEVVMAYDGDECLIWPYSRNGNRYGKLLLDGRHQIVSRVVCERAHGAPPTPAHEASHSCGNGAVACCTQRHLSWKTPSDNNADKLIHGTDNRGERHNLALLTESEVLAIRALRGKATQREIGARFGITVSHVCDIHRGRTWAWLNPEPGLFL